MSSKKGAPKGISFGYQTFLWQAIGMIRKVQIEGDFGTALKMAVSLIPYLPTRLKDQFRKRSSAIIQVQNMIAQGALPQLKKIDDLFQKMMAQNKIMTVFSSEALSRFIDDMSSELDKEGYFLPTKEWEEGNLMENFKDLADKLKEQS